MFSHFDPELKITPATGKVFNPETEPLQHVCALPAIALATGVLQDNVLVHYNGRQEIALAKGVSDSFRQLIKADSILIDGRFILHEADIDYAIPGIGLASTLGVSAGFVAPLEIYAPRREGNLNPSDLSVSSRLEYAFVAGVFSINQPVYDENCLILPIRLVRSLLNYETEISALELMLQPGASLQAVKKEIRTLLGTDFRVQDRYEQQEVSYKMMQIEKWVTFLILLFILTIALFNVVSSLSMLMIEKHDDVQMLRSMGADDRLIRRIFLCEGSLIPALGALAGIIAGILLCLLQQRYGLIKLGNTAGTFVMDNYPVRMDPRDILVIFLTVCTIGFLASWYPVHYWGKKWLDKRQTLLLICIPLLLSACSAPQSKRQSIVVTIEPQRYFATRIAGEQFAVHTVVPPGQSPETYDPAPHEMMHISRSKAYLRIGRIGFEQAWINTIRENNPHLIFFDLSEGIRWMENETTDCLHNESEHHHHHDKADPHIWNATGTAKIIARNTLQAFLTLDPSNETFYRENCRALLHEIEETERTLHAMLDTLTRRTFVIYHPALTYFAAEFHLTQLAIEAEGKEPSAVSMKQLVDRAKEANVQVVFIQQEFDRKHAMQIAAEIGARVVTINPLDIDWSKQMIYIAAELRK
jgi:ABC-type Zn uptake system ZnuABC Zn-binding protein ZnuA/ABC-type lipoprotein release transport system permease subunit